MLVARRLGSSAGAPSATPLLRSLHCLNHSSSFPFSLSSFSSVSSHPEFEIITPPDDKNNKTKQKTKSKPKQNVQQPNQKKLPNHQSTNSNTINNSTKTKTKSSISAQDSAVLSEFPSWEIEHIPAPSPVKTSPPLKSLPKPAAPKPTPPKSPSASSITTKSSTPLKAASLPASTLPPKSHSPAKPTPKTAPSVSPPPKVSSPSPAKPSRAQQTKAPKQPPPLVQENTTSQEFVQHPPPSNTLSTRQQTKPVRSPFPNTSNKSRRASPVISPPPQQYSSSTIQTHDAENYNVDAQEAETEEHDGVEVAPESVEEDTELELEASQSETTDVDEEGDDAVESDTEVFQEESEVESVQSEDIEAEVDIEQEEKPKKKKAATKEPAKKTSAKKEVSKKEAAKKKKARAKKDDDDEDEGENPEPSVDPELDPSLLTPEQEKVIQMIEAGNNIFFTGSAGTGKSFVLKHLIARMRKRYPKGVYLTAATGIAAVNIGGVTLHSFAGVHFSLKNKDTIIEQLQKRKKILKRWKQCKVLIIDEVSMVEKGYFDRLEEVARIVRDDPRPFGGIQLVLCGDFFQLPPVKGQYVFEEGGAWGTCVNLCLELTTVMRQNDSKFISILNELRRGMMTDTSMLELRKCCRPLDLTDGIIPTKLYTTNKSVDAENKSALDKLEAEIVQFTSHDQGEEHLLDELRRVCPKVLDLKIGAQVVLLRKVEKLAGLVNGSRGVVIGYTKKFTKKNRFADWHAANPHAQLPIVRFTNGKEVAIPPVEWEILSGGGGENKKKFKTYRHQLPLKLAWALTIHRAQGMTLDKAECMLSEAFASGQAYVALSRVRNLAGLYLKDFDRRAIKVNFKVLGFYKKIQFANGLEKIHIEASKASIRRNNTGNIASFSEARGMLVRPQGQRIVHPSVPLAIGPNNTTRIQAPIPPATPVTPMRAISGAFLNTPASSVTASTTHYTTTTTSRSASDPDAENEDAGNEYSTDTDTTETTEVTENSYTVQSPHSDHATTYTQYQQDTEYEQQDTNVHTQQSEQFEYTQQTEQYEYTQQTEEFTPQPDQQFHPDEYFHESQSNTSTYSAPTNTHKANGYHPPTSNLYKSNGYHTSSSNTYKSNGYHNSNTSSYGHAPTQFSTNQNQHTPNHSSNGYKSNGYYTHNNSQSTYKSNGYTNNNNYSNNNNYANNNYNNRYNRHSQSTAHATQVEYKPVTNKTSNNWKQHNYKREDGDEEGEAALPAYEGSLLDHLTKFKM